jgi:hypothetical protein
MNSRFYPYATDSSERDRLAYVFATIAIAIAYLAYFIVDKLHVQIPWWTALPSPMPIYLFAREIFGRYIWRWRLLHDLGIVKIVDINGTYKGHLWTSHEGGEKHPCTLVISQTWTRICIRGTFPKSTSFNLVTGISVEDTLLPRLTYEYWNTPNADAAAGMQAHRGTIWFDIALGTEVIELKGDYYTGRGRETIGRISVHRER